MLLSCGNPRLKENTNLDFMTPLTTCKKKHKEKGKENLNSDEAIDYFVSGSCFFFVFVFYRHYDQMIFKVEKISFFPLNLTSICTS